VQGFLQSRAERVMNGMQFASNVNLDGKLRRWRTTPCRSPAMTSPG
jgi:hypothetical protein